MTDHPIPTEELHHALDAHALTVAPKPPPARAIIEASRRRTARRRTGGLVACGVAFVTAALLVTGPGDPEPSPVKPLPAAPPKAPTTSAVRTVAPGERVTTWPGHTIWLTEDGRLCDQLKRTDPSCVTLVGKPSVHPVIGAIVGERKHWTGNFTAPGAARVVARDAAGGVHTAVMVVLAGESGRGGWYVNMPVPDGPSQLPKSLTVYDADGEVIVEQKLSGD